MTLILPSFAKINWTLEVLGGRADGYHELRTILQTVSLGDELRFSLIDDGIEVICETPGVPTDERNLVHRAARLLAEFAGVRPRVRIELVKRIPAAAGLGGGSSNAAVTLIALQRLWGVKLAPHDLFTLGARLGADVPCFFLGGTSLGIGRGDEVYPLPDIRADHLLLVNAGVAVPTAEVYGNLPPELTKPVPAASMPFSLGAAYAHYARAAGPIPPLRSLLRNDLEGPVLARHRLLAGVKERLTRAGADGVMMSGSGSTIFAVFDSDAALDAAQAEISSTGWWTAKVRALGRDEYQKSLRFGM
ncbi:MAG TPA: 4-(cytidine 5'-diphospho)-2-C-methyl-D-erythritol kinase [Blastocatellia bacterium]|nr:4-(cytidine 5'-diphospho)-2-C-methyl-D-erythritol kinase [Blastocatellia bacterium]